MGGFSWTAATCLSLPHFNSAKGSAKQWCPFFAFLAVCFSRSPGKWFVGAPRTYAARKPQQLRAANDMTAPPKRWPGAHEAQQFTSSKEKHTREEEQALYIYPGHSNGSTHQCPDTVVAGYLAALALPVARQPARRPPPSWTQCLSSLVLRNPDSGV